MSNSTSNKKQMILEWVLMAFFVAIGGLMLSSATQRSEQSERIMVLEKFMDEGRRYTNEDGELHYNKLKELIDQHEQRQERQNEMIIKLLSNDKH